MILAGENASWICVIGVVFLGLQFAMRKFKSLPFTVVQDSDKRIKSRQLIKPKTYTSDQREDH